MPGAPSTELDQSVQRSIAPNAFASTLREDAGILAGLAAGLPQVASDRELVLRDDVEQMFTTPAAGPSPAPATKEKTP